MKKIEKPITIEQDDSFKVILSKYGALALDKQENLSELIGETIGELDIEKGVITFGDITFPVQILGFYMQDAKQWSWAWDNEDIFGENLITSACEIKGIGDEFDINEFKSPVLNADFDDCHTLAMTSTAILGMDAYYAVSEEGLDIFVLIKSDLIKENNSVEKFRNTYYTFQKNFNIYPKIAFEAYTKLKGYIYKPHDEFSLAKIGEARVMAGFTERGNVTRILMFGEDEE
ncbi:MAG: hypothetical protein IJ672_01055 [Methanobrevibacter sp.]|uniref:DUF6882 domain-containing protein n=1 Tax=Methanobrevibacter sp. TaxID=66852 RepID=UPI0025F8C5B9|nr:DUF6882 domain-containing protein [Methanobrevibacter sp.]MBQ8017182.1 hypothetical protein [Methanobrevibacter sp.]MBR1610069.1 hypothetical protein [Methanobrevibacter sp.]